MAHLGDRITALVDGQLSADAVERAHAHLAHCRPCREAVEAERLMKARLASLCGPEPGSDLMQRLLAMGGPNGPLPPRVGHVPGMPRTPAVAMPRITAPPVPVGSTRSDRAVTAASPRSDHAGGPRSDHAGGPRSDHAGGPAIAVVDRPAGRRPAREGTRAGSTGPGRAPSRRRTRLAVAAMFGALSVVGVGLTGFAAGAPGGSPAVPTVVPPVDTFVVDHARTTRDLPFVDVPAGWQLTAAVQGGGAGR